MTEKTSNLAEKIASARVRIGSLTADKRNLEQKYSYISSDKILERAGDILSALGVTIYPEVVNFSIDTVARDGKSPRIDALLRMRFTVSDGAESQTLEWIGVGSDYTTPDKAVYKAITSGHKYFLMKLLLVGVGNEDGEHENEPAPSVQPARTTRPQFAPEPARIAEPAPVIMDVESTASDQRYPPGNITPKMLVDNGLAKDIPGAAEIINKLNVAGKPAAEFWPRVILYRQWREAGHDTSASAIAAIAGEQLP